MSAARRTTRPHSNVVVEAQGAARGAPGAVQGAARGAPGARPVPSPPARHRPTASGGIARAIVLVVVFTFDSAAQRNNIVMVSFGFAIGWAIRDDRRLFVPAPEEVPTHSRQHVLRNRSRAGPYALDGCKIQTLGRGNTRSEAIKRA
jgi:hypothetical protein